MVIANDLAGAAESVFCRLGLRGHGRTYWTDVVQTWSSNLSKFNSNTSWALRQASKDAVRAPTEASQNPDLGNGTWTSKNTEYLVDPKMAKAETFIVENRRLGACEMHRHYFNARGYKTKNIVGITSDGITHEIVFKVGQAWTRLLVQHRSGSRLPVIALF